MLIPYHVDVPMRRLPWMNWAIMALTVVVYPFCLDGDALSPLGKSLMLRSQDWWGFFTHVLVHADLFHLLGNMLFLWVFGNSVCAKVGSGWYAVIYFALGLAAGLGHYALNDRPAIGASGAINGIVGMYVVFYLLNDISCWYGYWYFNAGGTGTFSVSSFWLVLLWLAFDIWGAIRGAGNIAVLAHLSGILAGFVLAVLLLQFRLVTMDRGERSLLQLFFGEQEPPPRVQRKARHA